MAMTVLVDVTYHEEPDGAWWADSPQVPGFVAGGDSLSEVRQLVAEGVPFYLDTQDVDIREAREGGARLDVTFDMIVAAWAPAWEMDQGLRRGATCASPTTAHLEMAK
jgi:predicted RNase H-like HicB family nuclease